MGPADRGAVCPGLNFMNSEVQVKDVNIKSEEKFDVVALGELLIDFTESAYTEAENRLFEQNPGGAPANLLTAASHMGYRTAFIGKVGTDMHGAFLKATLEKEGIDVKGIVEDPDYFTTLAFVEIDKKGERKFSFARKPGADLMLRKEEIPKEMLAGCKIFHFGSLSLTDDPARSATIEAIKLAKEAGAVISYDPNYRASLWKSQEIAVETMKAVLPLADMLKVSDEESLLLTGKTSYAEAADAFLSLGLKVVAITMGDQGVLVAGGDEKTVIKAFSVKAVDTTGAGDSFWGGFLSCFLSLNQSIDRVVWEDIKKCAAFGNAVAALCVQKRGGIPSIPDREAVFSFMEKRGLQPEDHS